MNEEQEDALGADYDAHWGEIEETHRSFVERFLSMLPERGRVLDVPCGTGKYFGLVLDCGRSVSGVDHTPRYLAAAAAKFPGTPTEKHDLQALPYRDEFDGVMCVDSMEFVPPEEWPLVLERFRAALRPAGWLYLTVELVPAEALRAGNEAARRLGLPVVDGEAIWEEPDWYYHYYPSLKRVRGWLSEGGFRIHEELEGPWQDGEYAYHHVLASLEPR
jgi:SAM-dependent methyltransferase